MFVVHLTNGATVRVTADVCEHDDDNAVAILLTNDEIVATFPHHALVSVIREDAEVKPAPQRDPSPGWYLGDYVTLGPTRALYRVGLDPDGTWQLEPVPDEPAHVVREIPGTADEG